MSKSIEYLRNIAVPAGETDLEPCLDSPEGTHVCTLKKGHHGIHLATYQKGGAVVIARAWQPETTRIRYRPSYLVRRVEEYDVDVPTELLDGYIGDLDQWITDNDDPESEDYESADDGETEREILHRY